MAISFADELDDGELLTGTPTVAEIDTSTLTFASQAVSTAILTISGKTVPIGEAVQVKITPSVVGSYRITASCDTDATPAQTILGSIWLQVVAD